MNLSGYSSNYVFTPIASLRQEGTWKIFQSSAISESELKEKEAVPSSTDTGVDVTEEQRCISCSSERNSTIKWEDEERNSQISCSGFESTERTTDSCIGRMTETAALNILSDYSIPVYENNNDEPRLVSERKGGDLHHADKVEIVDIAVQLLPRSGGESCYSSDEEEGIENSGNSNVSSSEPTTSGSILFVDGSAITNIENQNRVAHEEDAFESSAFSLVNECCAMDAGPLVVAATRCNDQERLCGSVGDDSGEGLDRVCVACKNELQLIYISKDKDTKGRQATSIVTVEMEGVTAAAWNAEGSCLAVGDALGHIHLVLPDGSIMVTQSLDLMGTVAGDNQDLSNNNSVNLLDSRTSTSRAVVAIEFVYRVAPTKCSETVYPPEELVAVTKSGILLHMGNLCLGGIEKAITATPPDLKTLRSLKSSFSATRVKVSRDPVSLTTYYGIDCTSVFLVTKGGLSLWQRSRRHVPSSPLVLQCEVDSVQQQPGGQVFGCGFPALLRATSDGSYLLVADSAGGLGCWDTKNNGMTYIHRWTWWDKQEELKQELQYQSTTTSIQSMALLPEEGNGENRSLCVACVMGSNLLIALLSPSPPFEASLLYYNKIHMPWDLLSSSASLGVMVATPSTDTHRIFLVSAAALNRMEGVVESCTGIELHEGCEILPLHHMRALIADGAFRDALDFVKEANMNYEEVYLAYLAIAIKRGDSGSLQHCSSDSRLDVPLLIIKEVLSGLRTHEALQRAKEILCKASKGGLGAIKAYLFLLRARLAALVSHDRAFLEALLPQVDDCLRRLVTYEMLVGNIGSNCNGGSSNINTPAVSQKMTSSDSYGSCPPLSSVVMKGWNWFRNCELEDALELCLKAGEILGAIVIWRRHTLIGAAYISPLVERGVGRKFEDKGQSEQHMKSSSQTYLLLPSLLQKLPTSVPPFPLAAWLRDEVIPILPVEGVIEIKTWAKSYVERMESTDGSPHSAAMIARAVVEGSTTVLGTAATARRGLRWEQQRQWRRSCHHHLSEEAAESESTQQVDGEECIREGGEDPCGFGLMEAYWKPDRLDVLTRDLKDLVYAWDHHHLCLSLSEFQTIGREAAVLRVIDRVKDPNILLNEIQNHTLPLAKRFGLRGQECLLRYVTSCTKFITTHRSRKDCSGGSDYRSTELRAVAVVRCMEAEEEDAWVIKEGEDSDHRLFQRHSSTITTATDLRVAAVLNLIRSVCFPFSSELLSLAEDALSWKNVTLSFREELQEATRILNISQIISRHGVVGFSMVESSQASIIVRHIATKVSCPTALADALQVACAYSHLSERRVYVDYIQNLIAFMDSEVVKLIASSSSKEAPLDAHCSRVMAILNDLPQRDACSIVQEILLYALRTIEDLQQDSLFAREGMKLGEIEGSLGSLFPCKRGLELVREGSDAEEAMLLTAAACRLAAFLRDSVEEEEKRSRRSSRTSLQESIGSHSLGIAPGRHQKNTSYLSPSFLLPVLGTLYNLQCEFGIFVPLNLLEKPCIAGRGEWECSEEFASVMSLLFERINDILHGDLCAIRERGDGRAASTGLGKIHGNSHSPPSNMRSDGLQRLQKQEEEMGQGVDEVLRIRRLAELLSVPWSRVMVHCGKEAAKAGCVKDALRFCRLLTNVQSANSSGEGSYSSSLALRDAAVILLKFIAFQGKSGGPLFSLSCSDYYYHHQHYNLSESELEDMTAADIPETAEGLKLMQVVLESMALSLEGIQQSALACDLPELPRMVDLLQGANTLVDLLSRSSAGAELDSLLNQSQSSSRLAAKAIGGVSIEGSPAIVPILHKGRGSLSRPLLISVNDHRGISECCGCWGLTWFRAPSLVLPSGLGLRLAGSLMLQEMRVREEVGGGDPIVGSSNAATGTNTLPTRTVTMMRLLEFLEDHGGLQLSMRVILSMRLQPPEAFSFLRSNLSAMATKSLSSLKLDLMYILGLLLSIPQKEALATYQHALLTTQGDFVRLRELACLGIELGWAWRKNELLTHCMELERNAYWWDVLTTLQVPFDHMNFGSIRNHNRLDEDGGSLHVTDSYAMSLVHLILKQSGGNISLTLDYCAHYVIHQSRPLILFVEQQLLDDTVPSYRQDVLSVLPNIKEDEQLVKLLQRLLSVRYADSPLCLAIKHDFPPLSGGNSSCCIDSTDYERLHFICSLLAELSKDEEEVKFVEHGMEILVLLQNTPLPNSLEQIPFYSLLLDPWNILSPFLTPETMIKLIPLCLILNLPIGECYLQMVRTMYEVAKMEGNSPPSWTSVQPWIDKIYPSELACKALMCIADQVESEAEVLNVLQLAMSKAKEAMTRTEEDVVCNFENVAPPRCTNMEIRQGEGLNKPNNPISTSKVPVTAVVSSSHEGGEDDGSSLAEKLYKELKVRLCAMYHSMVLNNCLGRELTDSLSPLFMGGAEDLLLELFSRASFEAAVNAVQEEKGGKVGGCSTMDAYRATAGSAYRAACLIAEQRGLDSHDVERVRQKLALHWIFSTSSNEGELGKRSSRDSATKATKQSSRGGSCPLLLDNNHQTLSVFSKTGRELSKETDTLAVLRVAFVSSICSNLDGSIDSILSMDLKTKVDSLLSLAREGRHGKATYRSRWRALHAAGIIAPKRTVAHIYYKSSQAFTQDSTAAVTSSSPKEKCGGEAKLSMLSHWALHIGYMVDLEMLGLGFSLDEVMSCDKANLTRGLLRDHPVMTPPISDRFTPLLCDMCLDAGVTDAPLWDSLLVRMDKEGLHRHLLLNVLPRLSYTATQVGELASTVWSNTMRRPLQQLLNQREALKKARLVCSHSNSNSPGGGEGVVSPSTTVEEPKYESLSNNLDQQSLFHDIELSDIITVLDAVVYCMRCCPCIDVIDVRWHVNGILSLENPLLHRHAILIAASAHLPMERASLLVRLVTDFGICSSAVLNEVRAGQEIRNDKQVVVVNPIHSVETSHRGIVNAIFDAVDSLDKHGELIDSDHLEAFARYLVLHNREEKLLHFCLAQGRHSEAERIVVACNAMTGRNDRVNASEALEIYRGSSVLNDEPQSGSNSSSES